MTMLRWPLLLLLLTQVVWAGDGWRLQQQDAGREIRVYLRKQAERPYDDIYAVTQIDGRVAQIEAILADVPALPEWGSRISKARLIRRDGAQAWIHIQYKLPYPLKPRDVVVKTEREISDGAVTVRSRSVTDVLPPQPGVVRLRSVQSTWRLTPVANDQVKIELWGSAEPGGLIPALIYNYNLPDDALQTMRQLRRMSVREKYHDVGKSPDEVPKAVAKP